MDSTSADIITRLKLGKTLFNNQLFAIGLTDDNTCKTCSREYDINISEDYRHALFQCPAVQTIINDISNTFFPHQTIPFDIAEIIVSIISDLHTLFKGFKNLQALYGTIFKFTFFNAEQHKQLGFEVFSFEQASDTFSKKLAQLLNQA